MYGLKERARIALKAARMYRVVGSPRLSAYWLAKAGELRRSALYVYGRAS